VDTVNRTSSRFAARPPPPKFPRLEPRHIPCLIPEEAYQRHLSGLSSGLSAQTLRAFTSIAIVRTLGISTWDGCGDALGWERNYTRGLVNNAVVKLNLTNARDGFWSALELVRHELVQAHLVDYRQRERIFKDWALIPLDDWTGIRCATGISNDRCGARRRNASAWVWARITGLAGARHPP
jgi:hypothetical protein